MCLEVFASPDPNDRVTPGWAIPLLRRLTSLNVNGCELHWEDNQGSIKKVIAVRDGSHEDNSVITIC